MNYLKNQVNDVFLTLILAITILWLVYIFTPMSHYNLYIIEPKKE